MKSIIINPAYGNGPYLRATEIALALQEKLDEDLQIVVPHLYADKQIKVMVEQFGESDDIILDDKYGKILRKIFFEGDSYEDFLKSWMESFDHISKEAADYLHEKYDCAIEIARAPLIDLNIHPAYYTSFGRSSEILRMSKGIDAIDIDDDLLEEAARRRKEFEDTFDLHFITVPGTCDPGGDIAIPPTTSVPECHEDVDTGIYVTVSGIPNVESLQEIADHFPVKVYASDPSKIEGSELRNVSVIAHDQIEAHVARAGWGAVWSSLLTDTPIVVPPHDADDDPEIYFNIQKIEELGIGAVFNGQSLEEIAALKPGIALYRQELEKRFGTLNGAEFAAEKIAEDFQKNAANP